MTNSENEVSQVPKHMEDLPEPAQESFEELLDQFADPVEGEKNVLDAGCGYGIAAEYLEDEHGLDVVGVDTDTERIVYAQNNKPGEYREDSIINLEDEDNSYEAVFCNSVTQFFPLEDEEKPDLEDVITELDRVLKPGGTMYLSFKLGDEEYITREGEERKRYRVTQQEIEELMPENYQELQETSIGEINNTELYHGFWKSDY